MRLEKGWAPVARLAPAQGAADELALTFHPATHSVTTRCKESRNWDKSMSYLRFLPNSALFHWETFLLCQIWKAFDRGHV